MESKFDAKLRESQGRYLGVSDEIENVNRTAAVMEGAWDAIKTGMRNVSNFKRGVRNFAANQQQSDSTFDALARTGVFDQTKKRQEQQEPDDSFDISDEDQEEIWRDHFKNNDEMQEWAYNNNISEDQYIAMMKIKQDQQQ